MQNKAASFLFVAICPLTSVGGLQKCFQHCIGTRKVLVGTLTLRNKQHYGAWHTPTVGLIFVWHGKVSECTNHIADGFFQTSLSFFAPFDPAADAYKGGDGKPLDEYELPVSFFLSLVSRHAMPGDTVLDIHSGAGACASAAYSYGRNCIVIEPDSICAQWISTRLRSCTTISLTGSELEDEIEERANEFDEVVNSIGETSNVTRSYSEATKVTSSTDELANSTASGPKHGSQRDGEAITWKCDHCGKHCEVDEEKTSCSNCSVTLHIRCAKSVGEEPELSYKCPIACEQVCIHTLPEKWIVGNFPCFCVSGGYAHFSVEFCRILLTFLLFPLKDIGMQPYFFLRRPSPRPAYNHKRNTPWFLMKAISPFFIVVFVHQTYI